MLSDILLAIDHGDEAALIALDLTAARHCGPRSPATASADVFRYPGGRAPVISAGTVAVRTTRGCQVNCRRAYMWCAAGPLQFIMYTADLVPVIESHGLSPHMYADDTQVYGSCRPAAVDDFSSKISECQRCFQLDEIEQAITEL